MKPPTTRMTTTPLLVTTLAYLVAMVLTLPALGMVFLNDSNNREAYAMGCVLLIMIATATVAHIVVACIATRRYIRVNTLAKTAFISHLTLAGTLLIAVALGTVFMLIGAMLRPDTPHTNGALVLSLVASLVSILGILVLPLLSLICLITAFLLLAKPPVLPDQSTPPPTAS